jgi:hypothetical protein
MNGHYTFHYGEALNKIGPIRGYVPDSWNEIDVAQALPTAAFGGMTQLPPPLPNDEALSDTSDPLVY